MVVGFFVIGWFSMHFVTIKPSLHKSTEGVCSDKIYMTAMEIFYITGQFCVKMGGGAIFCAPTPGPTDKCDLPTFFFKCFMLKYKKKAQDIAPLPQNFYDNLRD
jgi:hypothetical protein